MKCLGCGASTSAALQASQCMFRALKSCRGEKLMGRRESCTALKSPVPPILCEELQGCKVPYQGHPHCMALQASTWQGGECVTSEPISDTGTVCGTDRVMRLLVPALKCCAGEKFPQQILTGMGFGHSRMASHSQSTSSTMGKVSQMWPKQVARMHPQDHQVPA